MTIENSGEYNPLTYEDFRVALESVDGDPVTLIIGGDKELQAGMDSLETTGHSFVWTEATGLVLPEHALLSPRFLQSKRIRPEHLNEVGASRSHASRIATEVYSVGPRTYADVLALGSEALIEASRHVHRGVAIGEKSLAYLRAAVWRQTGYRLPSDRATVHGLLDYYDEIERATIALVLPYGKLRVAERVPGVSMTLGEAATYESFTLRGLARASRQKFIVPFYEAKLSL